MLSGKHISKITFILVSVILTLCILAMVFEDKLTGITNPSGYGMEYQQKLFNTSQIIDIDIKAYSRAAIFYRQCLHLHATCY